MWCLRIVDDAIAAADSLTPCLVAVGRLTCSTAEPAGLMPAQQSLTLQTRTDQINPTNHLYTLETQPTH